jgi:hypothetical protein
MKQSILIISVVFVSGCCSYDKNDFEFNEEEIRHLSNYQVGDTVYFQSNLGDTDTITIAGFGTERKENCGGFMGRQPVNGKWIQIRHLPIDSWFGTSQDVSTGYKVDTVCQELFWISKHPIRKQVLYAISFKDFHSGFDTLIGKFHQDTIELNDLIVSGYYLVEHEYPERVTEPNHIEKMYWTDKFGLTAYKSKGGEIWTRNVID